MRVILLSTLLGFLLLSTCRGGQGALPPVGDVTSEPIGFSDSLLLLHEDLLIDLRAMATADGRASISTRYILFNPGTVTQSIPLSFPLGAQYDPSIYTLLFDGRRLSAGIRSEILLPPDWSLPTSLPSPTGQRTIPFHQPYWPDSRGYVRFRGDSTLTIFSITFNLSVPPGRHEMQVNYGAAVSASAFKPPVYIWQIGYVLSPARRWKGYGGLSARILYPEGWTWATSPAMKQTDDGVLEMEWSGVPADHLGIAVRPVPPHPAVEFLLIQVPAFLCGLLLVLAAGINGWKLGSRSRQLDPERRGIWNTITVLGLLTFPLLLVGGATQLEILLTDLLMQHSAFGTYRFMTGMAETLLFMLAVPIIGAFSFDCGKWRAKWVEKRAGSGA